MYILSDKGREVPYGFFETEEDKKEREKRFIQSMEYKKQWKRTSMPAQDRVSTRKYEERKQAMHDRSGKETEWEKKCREDEERRAKREGRTPIPLPPPVSTSSLEEEGEGWYVDKRSSPITPLRQPTATPSQMRVERDTVPIPLQTPAVKPIIIWPAAERTPNSGTNSGRKEKEKEKEKEREQESNQERGRKRERGRGRKGRRYYTSDTSSSGSEKESEEVSTDTNSESSSDSSPSRRSRRREKHHPKRRKHETRRRDSKQPDKRKKRGRRGSQGRRIQEPSNKRARLNSGDENNKIKSYDSYICPRPRGTSLREAETFPKVIPPGRVGTGTGFPKEEGLIKHSEFNIQNSKTISGDIHTPTENSTQNANIPLVKTTEEEEEDKKDYTKKRERTTKMVRMMEKVWYPKPYDLHLLDILLYHKQEKLSKFNGIPNTPGGNVEAFLGAVNVRYDRMKNDGEKRELRDRVALRLAENALEGDVVTWWNNQKAGRRDITFKKFKTLMMERWAVRYSTTEVLSKLSSPELRQKKGETLSSFGDRIQMLGLKGGLEGDDLPILNAFVNQLNVQECGKIQGKLGTWLNKKIEKSRNITFSTLLNKANDLAKYQYKGETQAKEKSTKKEGETKGRVAAIPDSAQGSSNPPEEKECMFHPGTTNHSTAECRTAQYAAKSFQREKEEGGGRGGNSQGRGGYRGRGRGRGQSQRSNQNPRYFPNKGTTFQTNPSNNDPPTQGSTNNPPGQHQQQQQEERVCWKCNKPGHMAVDCVGVQTQMMLQQLIQTLSKNKDTTPYDNSGEGSRIPHKEVLEKKELKLQTKPSQALTRVKLNAKRKRETKKEGRKLKKIKMQLAEIKAEIKARDPIEVVTNIQDENLKEIKDTGEKLKKFSTGENELPVYESELNHIMAINEREEEINKGIEKKYTATFTTVKIYNKPIHTLADSGASHSIVAYNWLKYVGCENLMKESLTKLKDAQGGSMTVLGEVTLPVEFGNKIFDWEFLVVTELFCPLILGVNIMHSGSINFKKRRLKIEGQRMPITFTLNKAQHYTVVAACNRVIPAHELLKIKGKVINSIQEGTALKPQTYVINTGGLLRDSTVVNSKILPVTNKKGKQTDEERVKVLAMNPFNKDRWVKKGDILATLDLITDETHELLYADLNKSILINEIKTISVDNPPAVDSLHEGGVASIVAIRPKQQQLVSRQVPPNVDGCSTIQLPVNEGGLDIELPIVHRSGEGFGGNPAAHNRSVDSIVKKTDMEISGSDISRKGLKVPLIVDLLEKDMNIGMRQPDETGGSSRQPVHEGGPTHAGSLVSKQYESISNGMEDPDLLNSGKSTDVQGVEYLEEMKLRDPSCVLVSPAHDVSVQEWDDQTCHNIYQEQKEEEKLIFINSQEMLNIGNENLQKHLILEREKDNKDRFKGPPEEVIENMIKECECTIEQKEKLKEVLINYKEILVSSLTPEFTGGNAYFQPHEIILEHNNPIWTNQYPVGRKEHEIIEEMAQEQYRADIIEPSTTTKYNSPVLVVPKKGSQFSTATAAWRPVIDFRNINKATVKENWPIPRTEEAIDALCGAKYITTLDATSGYWQIPLSEESKAKTAFQTLTRRWQYKCLPMGITNAAPTFQKNMEIMLSGLLWKCCVVYIDDIIIYSNTFEEHLHHLEEVFKRLKMCNVVIKPAKCKLARKETIYLGHIVGNGQLKPDPDNITAIKDCPLPQTIQEVRSFTMLASYYRRFVHQFAHIAKPLTDYMKLKGKKTKITLSEEAIQAVQTLKERLTSNPTLKIADTSKPFELRTDASDHAIGGVLFQRDEEGEEQPVWYGSRRLSKTEERYSATEREMLAIQYFVTYWRPYLWGTKFKVYTDHSPLKGIKAQKGCSRRITGMILKLQEYDFDLYYTPGRDNVVADALSREPIAPRHEIERDGPIEEVPDTQRDAPQATLATIRTTIPKFKPIDPSDQLINGNDIKLIAIEVVAGSQGNKRAVKKTMKKTNTTKELEDAKEQLELQARQLHPFKIKSEQIAEMQLGDESLAQCIQTAATDKMNKNWVWHNDCLHHIRRQRRKGRLHIQLVLPMQLREEVMKAHHDELLAGHCGYFKTTQKIQRWYWWPGMSAEIRKWVQECPVCQQHTRQYTPIAGKLAPIIATRPFQIMGMDILCDLPKTDSGNTSIVLFTDYYTKWVEAFPMPNMETITVAGKLISGVICRHGAPERIISDRGSNFTADVFKEVNTMLGVKQSFTASYSPQADGQAEKAIGTLHNTLSKLPEAKHKNWDIYLPYAYGHIEQHNMLPQEKHLSS